MLIIAHAATASYAHPKWAPIGLQVVSHSERPHGAWTGLQQYTHKCRQRLNSSSANSTMADVTPLHTLRGIRLGAPHQSLLSSYVSCLVLNHMYMVAGKHTMVQNSNQVDDKRCVTAAPRHAGFNVPWCKPRFRFAPCQVDQCCYVVLEM